MTDATWIVLYALIAGFSPLALLATLAILSSDRGRLKGFLFAVAFIVCQSLTLMLASLVGAVATPDRQERHETLVELLGIAAGVVLLTAALISRRSPPRLEAEQESRAERYLDRLGNLKIGTALSIGALLGVGGVKRLTLAVIAGSTIAAFGLTSSEELALGALYVVIACGAVWLPTCAYLVSGHHAESWAAALRAYVISHERRSTLVTTTVVGLLLISHGLVSLA